MNLFLAIFTLIVGFLFAHAQALNISGVVLDCSGRRISRAAVKLEIADICTTTDDEGRFSLVGNYSEIQHQYQHFLPITKQNIKLQNSTLTLITTQPAVFITKIYEVNGRLLFSNQQKITKGIHSIFLPRLRSGLQIIKVMLNDEQFTFMRTENRISTNILFPEATTEYPVSKKNSTTDLIDDVLEVKKTGQLDYHLIINNSDTNGIEIKMVPSAGIVTDINGNEYQTVRIGDQVWTAENLRTTNYNDGANIPHIPDNEEWNSQLTPAYCFHNNTDDPTLQVKFGALYNWYAVNTGKLAPAGWHIPTDADWLRMQEFLIANGYNWDNTTIENKIAKSLAVKTDWQCHFICTPGNTANDLSSNNSTGFSALPGSYRSHGYFYIQGQLGGWWSATEIDSLNARFWYLNYLHSGLLKNVAFGGKVDGFSVRLVSD